MTTLHAHFSFIKSKLQIRNLYERLDPNSHLIRNTAIRWTIHAGRSVRGAARAAREVAELFDGLQDSYIHI